MYADIYPKASQSLGARNKGSVRFTKKCYVCYTYVFKDRLIYSQKARVVTDRTNVSKSEENATQGMATKLASEGPGML